jgi:hypothetical protein
MSAMKHTLTVLAESIERELDCNFEPAMQLVLEESKKGTPIVDIFDTIVDRHLASPASA